MLIKEGKYEVQASWGSSTCGGMHLDSLLLSCVLRKMRSKGMGIGSKPCTVSNCDFVINIPYLLYFLFIFLSFPSFLLDKCIPFFPPHYTDFIFSSINFNFNIADQLNDTTRSVSENKATGENSDKEKNKLGINGVQELLPLSLKALVGPLKSELLLLCRIAKEKLSDDAVSHVAVRFPAALIRKYSGEYVMLRGKRICTEEVNADDDNGDRENEKEREGEGLEGEEVEEVEEEEEFKWAIMSPDKEEEDETDFLIEILREEFEAACLPVLEVRHTTITLSYPILSYPIISCLILSYPMSDNLILTYHTLSLPILSYVLHLPFSSKSRPLLCLV